ncbi:hypothetical protein A3F00_01415 [Candidatus Daviesbacteria bacterium RIFCSPHIGHO2_12_FULL_37_11]|uniref:Uncharacterized protein n=1 Tax=Candidatus Daviesbacteria bacterium RIFCSPHIGHO2_12_FULL_37_11 TaxID=1797777 RepID=A0A1F5KCN5_9BACT|nr:MAG: hypothetical protein A2111_02865 [Candidatus Daviesbacteria bacterium GWA1_38_6]OGE16440.1 MAG: hypothetical protein A2769_02060 [Candidatus Daviesbacteria bacterium RIFCSPHIGHO2_01_FULL_37_27]OGE38535.1 MAG: hypothetical protein A3F00_01415 [Candidatus Daviesbacteria bacterium RIFCSPHIGHO2_12_FULL_37_11]OGE46130.1 MAG: hypothetical protein A3B39_04555 [Candidatus Daviesbacteria bacterium RIFCSPLOWO2_01_FULL_37_10]
MNERDFEKYSEEYVSKGNRRRRKETDKNRMIVDSLPPTGIHEVKRKVKDRRRNQIIKKALKH